METTDCALAMRHYKRPLGAPLQSANHRIEAIDGFLIKITDSTGYYSFFELPPLGIVQEEPSLENTLQTLKQAHKEGFQSALARNALFLHKNPITFSAPLPQLPIAALLPNHYSQATLEALYTQGFRHFKIKIGVAPEPQEKETVSALCAWAKEKACLLRLDANGSLNKSTLKKWVQNLEYAPIEFLEQPLALGEEAYLAKLIPDISIPIALDESAVCLKDLKALVQLDWPGKVVIKPTLLDDWATFTQLRKNAALDCVYSAAFESAIGLSNIAKLALSDPKNRAAVGFGTEAFFPNSPFIQFTQASILTPKSLLSLKEQEAIWNAAIPII